MALVNKFQDERNPWRRWMIATAGLSAAIAIVAYTPLEDSYGRYAAGFASVVIIAIGMAICGVLQKRYYAWEVSHAEALRAASKKRSKRPHKKH